MTPSDVEKLLRSLLPALSISLAACDPATGASAGASASAGAGASAKAESIHPDGESVPESVPESKPKSEPKPEPKLMPEPKPELVPELKLKPERRTACPMQDWCGPKTAAAKLAHDEVDARGCPTTVSASSASLGRQGTTTYSELLKADFETYSGLFMGSRNRPASLDREATEAKRAGGDADACCYTWMTQCPGGRAFVDEQAQPIIADFESGAQWLDPDLVTNLPDEACEEAAKLWLADAAMEHASVASFGRQALELLALGAPAALIEQTHAAAIDEIRHAKICLSIARALGADPVQPGPMRIVGVREAHYSRLAADTFVEGCVGETTAALVMQRAAAGCPDPSLARVLAQIADDESEHAALAWRTVAWAIEEGGPQALAAVEAKARSLATAFEAQRPRATGICTLAAAGRLTPAQLSQARSDAWFGIVEPMLSRLMAG